MSSAAGIVVATTGTVTSMIAAELRLGCEAVGARVAAEIADRGAGVQRGHVGELNALAWLDTGGRVGGEGVGGVGTV